MLDIAFTMVAFGESLVLWACSLFLYVLFLDDDTDLVVKMLTATKNRKLWRAMIDYGLKRRGTQKKRKFWNWDIALLN